MRSKLVTWLLCAAMVLSMLPNIAMAEDSITISTSEELAKIGVDAEYPLSGSYVLDANLSLSEYEQWTPIGDSANTPFTGTFDGNGHSIEGMHISSDQRVGNKGLFGCVIGGTIKNLKVDGSVILTGSNCTNVGILAAYAANNARILNCFASGEVQGTNGVGGLVGGATNSTIMIENSCFIGDVYCSTTRACGGILCSLFDNLIINNCYAATTFKKAGDAIPANAGIVVGGVGNIGTIHAYGDISVSGGVAIPEDPNKTNLTYDVTGLTTEEMQSAAFAETLNGNITVYGDSTWSKWLSADGKYPVQEVFAWTLGPTPVPAPTSEPTEEPEITATPAPTATAAATVTPEATATAEPVPTPTATATASAATPTPLPTANPVAARSAYENMNFIDYNEYYTSAGENVIPETNAGGIMTRSRDCDQYVRFDNVDFGSEGTYAAELYARMTAYASYPDYTIDICIDTTDNVVGTLTYGQTYTASGRNYAIELNKKITGTHTVYIKWKDALIGFYLRFVEGTIDLSSYDGVLPATLAQMRVSENLTIHEDSYGDGGPCVQSIGKYSMLDSVSFPAVDFGDGGVSKTVTIRIARSNAMQVETEHEQLPCAKILLGDRDGEVIAETAIPESSAFTLGIWNTYTMELPEEITGVHMVTVEINYETKLRYVAFDYTEPEPEEPAKEIINGHEIMAMEAAEIPGGSFVGTNGDFMPTYLSGGLNMTYENVELNNAKYVTAYVRSGAASAYALYMDGSTEPSATFVASDEWAFTSITAELTEPLTGTHSFTIGASPDYRRTPDIEWIRFMTEEEYREFESRKKIAVIGDVNNRSGYLVYFSQLINSSEYQTKGFFAQNQYLSAFDPSAAVEYAPDIAMIMFGGADAASALLAADFEANYDSLISALRTANPDVKIYIQTPMPTQADGQRPNYEGVLAALNNIAQRNNTEIIDIYNGMLNFGFPRNYLMGANAVPTEDGARLIARLSYEALFPSSVRAKAADMGAVSVSADKTILNKKGESVQVSADSDVYWGVECLDGSSCTYARVDENGVVTALKPGIYKVIAVSKYDNTRCGAITMENRFPYIVASDADLIGNGAAAAYIPRAFKGVSDRYVVSTKDNMTVMLKGVSMERVNAMTICAASTAINPEILPVLECRLDAADGPVIGRTVVFGTAQNTEYAFLPITNSTIPVTDGELHNLFFIQTKGQTASGADVTINLKSIELLHGEAAPVVMKDGVILDRAAAVHLQDTSKDSAQYIDGEEYTWITAASDSTKPAQLIIAVHDSEGKLVRAAMSETGTGVLSASMILPDGFENCSLDAYVWEDGELKMKPCRNDTEVVSDNKLKIGLIGDSTTNNVTVSGITYENLCYPNYLRSILGSDKFDVMNFGRGTTTTGQYLSSHRIWFELAMESRCDVYFIMLGTNNAKGIELSSFEEDYQTIIDGLREASPGCKIYIMTPIPAQKDKYMIEEATLTQVIIPMVRNVAKNNGLPLIDMYSTLKNSERFDNLYGSDGIHENEEGMALIAETVRDVIMNEIVSEN